MSRMALLDIFLAFFVVAAVACLAADRDWFRNRLADHLEQHDLSDLGGRFGPALIVRPWRIAAGSVLRAGARQQVERPLRARRLRPARRRLGRRRAPARRRRAGATCRDPAGRHPRLRLAGGAVRGRLPEPPGSAGWPPAAGTTATGAPATRTRGRPRFLGAPLASLLHYQRDIWNFHTGDYIRHAQHSYRANPIGWLLIARPLGRCSRRRHRARHRTAAPAPRTASA